jgi:membrane protease YdiL (CAAX protease family)
MSESDPTAAIPDPPPTGPRGAERAQKRQAVVISTLVTLGVAAVISFTFSPERAGKAIGLIALGAVYAVFTAMALGRLHLRGELRDELRPHGGDLALGAITAAFLYGIAMVAHLAITGPGSPRAGWIMRVYLQLGDPTVGPHMLRSAAIFVVAALEEVTWRGLVMRSLEGPVGESRALLLSTALFAIAHAPTIVLLADASAGPNPLVVSAALGCSLVWGFIALRYQRLVPAIFAHALFSWAVVEFPIWRP